MNSATLSMTQTLRRSVWWVLLPAAVWLAFIAWVRPLTLPDEGRYAGVAWEMLRSQSYLTPLMDGMPYFHKPPLYYWLAQLSFATFGLNEWAARLPSLLIAWSSIAGCYLFVRRYRGELSARLTVLILATMPFFYGGAQFANMDMSVAGTLTLCVLAGADTILRVAAGQAWRSMAVATAVLSALAVLAKGLIGLVLPGAILLAWLLMRRDLKGAKALLWPPAILAFLVVASPWFVIMQMRYPGFFHYFFVYQHFERFALSGFNNVQPFWFYPPVLIGLILPWSFWLGGTLRRAYWGAEDKDGLRRLALIWVVVVVGFFSLPSSKLIGYILPAVPPLAMVIAGLASSAWEQGGRRRKLVQASAGVAAALCVAGILIAASNPRNSIITLAEQMRSEIGSYDTQVALHHFPFDLGIYTATTEPMWVVDDWSNPEIPTRDNWRKELYDAAVFEPEIGRQVLVSNDDFNARVCASPMGKRFWVWGQNNDADAYQILRGVAPAYVDGRRMLWRIDVNAEVRERLCAGMPTAGSPQK